jgi:hypothetical protein
MFNGLVSVAARHRYSSGLQIVRLPSVTVNLATSTDEQRGEWLRLILALNKPTYPRLPKNPTRLPSLNRAVNAAQIIPPKQNRQSNHQANPANASIGQHTQQRKSAENLALTVQNPTQSRHSSLAREKSSS